MASLKDLATAAEIRHAINNLRQGSDSYQSAYETAIQRIRGQSVSRTKLANRVLAWIVYAKRVLTASELRLALGVEIGKRQLDDDSCPDVDMMVSVCAGLVTIDESADTIRLVHYTAQTFFDNVKSTMFPSAEAEILRVCTTYLSLKIFAKHQHGDGYQSDSPSEGEDEKSLEQHSSKLSSGCGSNNHNATYWGISSRQTLYRNFAPQYFYDYAARYWGIHARETPDAHEDIMRFLSQRSYITRAYEAAVKPCGFRYWGGDDENQESTLISVDGLHLAALLGLEKAVEEILRECLYSPDVVIRLKPNNRWRNVFDGIGPYLTPLTIAAAQNHPRIVKMLLNSGATLGVVSLNERKNCEGTTALYAASEKGFEAIVDILLQAGERTMGDVEDLQIGQNELSRISKFHIGPRKRADELERRLQYTPRRNVDGLHNYGWSSTLTSPRGNWDRDKIAGTMRRGAGANSQSQGRYSPSVEFCTDGRDKDSFKTRNYGDIRGASSRGLSSYLVSFKKRDYDDIRGVPSRDLSLSLYVASANGHLTIVEKLLHHGAKVDATSKQNTSPLYAACAHGHIDIVRKLLQNGASVDAIHKYSLSPLHVACTNGHIDIARLLLQEGASVDAPHGNDHSPLHHAASKRHIDIASILLQKGASVDAPHGNDHSPLHDAASKGHTEIFKLLLQYGSGVHPLNHNGQIFSYLHRASAGGHVEIAKTLLEHGDTTHLMEEVQLSPIHATIEHGHLEVFNLLIRYGANPNQWRSKKTPLQLALHLQQQNGTSSILETMIEQLRELGGKTPRELRLQETLQLIQERREKNASSAGQQELVDLPGENS
jgi:ankyrin repeat protein